MTKARRIKILRKLRNRFATKIEAIADEYNISEDVIENLMRLEGFEECPRCTRFVQFADLLKDEYEGFYGCIKCPEHLK